MSTITLKNPRHLIKSVGRHGGWLPDRPNYHEDYLLERKLGAAPRGALPENPFLPPESYPPIRNQGEQGSCTGHGVRNFLMQQLLVRDKPFWEKYDLSPASAYLNGREIDNSVYEDSGSYIRSVMKGAGRNGVTREDLCPYDQKKLVTKLSKTAAKIALGHQAVQYYRCDEPNASPEQTITNIVRALAAGMPVVFGFTCFTNLGEADHSGVIPLPGPNDTEDGGHCMCVYEADTRSKMLIGPNSWGPWGRKGRDGQRGYFVLTFDYILQRLADDFWAGTHEPTPGH